MFDLYGAERLAEWKKFRDTLEDSEKPFEDVAKFWSRAPFVSRYLDPQHPESWPDPWHLILDDKLDDLAISLGMLYTLKLTHRFMSTPCEIHMSMQPQKNKTNYFLLVDNKHVLNLAWGSVLDFNEIKELDTTVLWSN